VAISRAAGGYRLAAEGPDSEGYRCGVIGHCHDLTLQAMAEVVAPRDQCDLAGFCQRVRTGNDQRRPIAIPAKLTMFACCESPPCVRPMQSEVSLTRNWRILPARIPSRRGCSAELVDSSIQFGVRPQIDETVAVTIKSTPASSRQVPTDCPQPSPSGRRQKPCPRRTRSDRLQRHRTRSRQSG